MVSMFVFRLDHCESSLNATLDCNAAAAAAALKMSDISQFSICVLTAALDFSVNALLSVQYRDPPQRSGVGHAHHEGLSRLAGQSSSTAVNDGPRDLETKCQMVLDQMMVFEVHGTVTQHSVLNKQTHCLAT